MHSTQVKASPTNDEELIDTLIAISVISKRLASKLRQENEKQSEENRNEKQRNVKKARCLNKENAYSPRYY